jgi:hypothetical protein
MLRRGFDSLIAHPENNQTIDIPNKGLRHLTQNILPGVNIPRPDNIPGLNVLNRNQPSRSQYFRARREASPVSEGWKTTPYFLSFLFYFQYRFIRFIYIASIPIALSCYFKKSKILLPIYK